MKFTKEQFENIGPFYMDEFPINSSNQDLMFAIFNDLPETIQGNAISFGCQDSEVQAAIFIWLCRNQLGLSTEEYYKSEVAKDYFENGVLIKYKSRILEK